MHIQRLWLCLLENAQANPRACPTTTIANPRAHRLVPVRVRPFAAGVQG